jgi:hypothetical protein
MNLKKPPSKGQDAPGTSPNNATTKPQSSQQSSSASSDMSRQQCRIKGNISSAGEKIDHLPNCGSYGQTVIDEPRGVQWFCIEPEAMAAGWRKAGNCR